MSDKKQSDDKDVWEKVMDWGMPIAAAATGYYGAKRLGRRVLPFKGKIIDRAKKEGMSAAKIQRARGSDWGDVTRMDALERIPGPTKSMTIKQREAAIKELNRAKAEADGYSRIGKARATLTGAGGVVGYKTGSDLNERRKRK